MTVESSCVLSSSSSTSMKAATPPSTSGVSKSGSKKSRKSAGDGQENALLRKAESEVKMKNTPKTGSATKTTKKTSSPSTSKTASPKEKVVKSENVETSETDGDEAEVSFEDYSQLCQRVAKTMYYGRAKPPTTPRPSLPLTILAVETFSKYARRDTLEFLDIDMAADIGRHACVSPTALVFALVYLERLSVNNPGYLRNVKPSELFVVSLLVASKFVQDDDEDLGIFNDEWATSANMELKRINQLELEFLTAIDWNVNIRKDEYEERLKSIEEKMALHQGCQRGWFTYTELGSLLNTKLSANVLLPILTQRVTEVISALCVMYTTFFATLMTSSAFAPYLLSLSKLALSSTGSHSLLVESSLSSCMQDISLQNSSNIPITQDIGRDTTLPATNIQRFIPSGQWLPLLKDQENDTEQNDILINERLDQLLTNALREHRRSYETANQNYGYSFKCESNCQRHYSDDENIANVQRVLENLLHSSNLLNPKRIQNYPGNPRKLHCFDKSGCYHHHHHPSLLQIQQSRPLLRV